MIFFENLGDKLELEEGFYSVSIEQCKLSTYYVPVSTLSVTGGTNMNSIFLIIDSVSGWLGCG